VKYNLATKQKVYSIGEVTVVTMANLFPKQKVY